jgi:hypothetical protein
VGRRGPKPRWTQRAFALLALIHVTACELATKEEEHRRRHRLPARTPRRIASDIANLADKTVSNKLYDASEIGVFTRKRPLQKPQPDAPKQSRMSIPHPRTTPFGYMTDEGWNLLGDDFARRFGDEWRRQATRLQLEAALEFLRAELRAETQMRRL